MQLTYQETEKLSARCELFREELSKSNQLIPEQMLAEYVLNLVQLGDSYYLRELLEMKSINLGSNFLLCALNTAFDYERSSCAALIREQIEIKMSPDIKGNWLDQSVIKDCETIHFSLVHYAADKNDMDFLNKLYEVGAPLNTLNRYGLSALNMSIANLNEEMVRALLEKGANPNLQDRNGWTPLYIAVSMGSKNISALLLAYGADPCIKSYDGETLFHLREKLNSELSNDKKISLADLIPISDKLAEQLHHLDCFGRSAGFYKEQHNTINVKQRFVIDKIEKYYDCVNHDKSLLSRGGYCNGFVFLTHYYDSCGRRHEHEKTLVEFVTWDGSKDTLDQQLTTPLAYYGTRREIFKEYADDLNFFFDPSRIKGIGIRQWSRDEQLAHMNEFNSLSYIFRQTTAGINFTRTQLVEFLSILQHLPHNSRFELTGAEHAVAFKLNDQMQFEYWDSEFPSPKPVVIDNPLALANFIIKTKYADMGSSRYPIQFTAQGEPIVSDIRFQGYYFARENVPMMTYNYFTSDTLPVTREAVDKFTAASALGFNPMHYAVLTNSKSNFDTLLNLPFAKELLNQNAKQSLRESPLEILFDTRNLGMLEIFMSKADKLVFNADYIQDKLLSVLESFADISQIENINRFAQLLDESHCKNFIEHLCYQAFQPHVMDAILKMLPLDKAKFSEQAISFLKNNSIDDNKKAILSKYLSSFDKEAKMSVGMHAALFPHEAIPPEVSSDASKSTLIDLTKSQNRAK